MNEIVLIHNLVYAKPLNATSDDVLLWGHDGDDDDAGFSVTAAYNKLLQPALVNFSLVSSEVIWKKGAPLKVQFFAWTAALDRITTFDLLQRRGFIWVNRCTMCASTMESASHLLLHCGYATEVWRNFMRSFNVLWAMPGTVMELLGQWDEIGHMFQGRGKSVWRLLAHAVFWCLWLERNSRCYDEVYGDWTFQTVLATRSLVGSWCCNSLLL